MTDRCPICGSSRNAAFTATVLGRHRANYHECPRCGLLQAETPHWLEEAYAQAIADADTGLLQRNLSVARQITGLLYRLSRGEGRFLDVAGGYGVLTRLMRDIGFDYYWSDPHTENIFARGFEAPLQGESYVSVTAIEVLEHVEDPVAFIGSTLERADSSTMIFTTELYEGDRPPLPSRGGTTPSRPASTSASTGEGRSKHSDVGSDSARCREARSTC